MFMVPRPQRHPQLYAFLYFSADPFSAPPRPLPCCGSVSMEGILDLVPGVRAPGLLGDLLLERADVADAKVGEAGVPASASQHGHKVGGTEEEVADLRRSLFDIHELGHLRILRSDARRARVGPADASRDAPAQMINQI
jgi:hypothetical protein